MQRVTRYAKSGDIHIAYQVFGEGPDLVVAPGFVSHIENYWDEPHFARWLNKAGGFCRSVMFDKRGTGLSDRVAHLPHMDERMDDLRAVMDAVGIERASLFGISEGGSLAALFAASHPERTQSLIIYGSFARFSHWIATDEAFDVILCDLMMGDMTGMDLYAELGRRSKALAARIVFMTGGVFTDGARDFLAGVPNICIEKPFDLAALRAMVAARSEGARR